ncbi:MAG: S9 family peptidase [Gemmatimonadetes bacterium]|nr:S9 family peptidase [Gemmatimonadota bacterium]
MILIAAFVTVGVPAVSAQAPARRPVNVNDLFRLRTVRDVQISPEGEWVAYVVGTLDSARDRSNTDLYMVSWDGSRTVQLTFTPEGESSPRWSPDGKYLSLVASRGESRSGGQIWLLDRAGGEAQKLTDLKSGVSDYQWSPDSKRIVIVAQDPDSAAQAGGDSARSRTAKPIVIDRYQFKQDGQGYLGNRRSHLYLFDVATKKPEQLTSGRYNENNPSWSPDGRFIAFVSERAPDPDRVNDANIYVLEARAGAEPRQLTSWPGPDGGRPTWSPDGKWVAYLQGSEPQYSAYSLNKLAVVPMDGSGARVLTAALDRPVSQPEWTSDSDAIIGLVTDDRVVYPARIRVSDGAVERLLDGRRVVSGVAISSNGRVAVLAGSATQPNEIYALEGGTLRALTHENDAWVAEVELGVTEDFSAKSKDGTIVNGLLVKPAGYQAETRYPTLLRIHGGPNGQDQHAFNFERELFAANGYAVIAANYRGSSGRGAAYQKAIYADWGNKEVQDLLAAVDYVVAMDVADPDRLGIGGWSYGGILTDYTIATTTRFKAATSGAGSALQTSMYGVDQYIYQYDTEVGPPWKNQALWEKISYPFWRADRIKTPTLFLGGEQDFNVPIAGGEQMYQALRSQHIDTQLIIYPGQFHGITTPSYQRDRLERYLAWYAKYLKPPPAAASP